MCPCLLPDLSFMEENGIYRIIFKNKVKAELLKNKSVCPREGGEGIEEGLAKG